MSALQISQPFLVPRWATVIVTLIATGGPEVRAAGSPAPHRSMNSSPPAPVDTEDFRRARYALVERDVVAAGVKDPAVLAAMRRVPRHLFVPEPLWREAYDDHPLPIGHGQTISQPSLVALMTEMLGLTPQSRVLEIGTGSGYQAAVLAEVAGEVYSIEIVRPLAEAAARALQRAGYERVQLRIGDGWQGWPEAAPFDAIIVTCAPEDVPAPLVAQLRAGGRLCIPVGPAGATQELLLLVKNADGALERRTSLPVRFVPMRRATP
ncbi:MAG: protein-L-isoaspartate(D-aspartate) O-methyltransferase [Opitutaceae bacterium]